MSVHAQSLTEVLYLKNGNVIRGTIIEQVPNESIKIQTVDGSIFAYSMADVLKITKEQQQFTNNQMRGSMNSSNTGVMSFKNNNAAHRGYAGFVELGGGLGLNTAGAFVNMTTSHGYQIIPQLFTGIGAGAHFDIENSLISVPTFVDIRYNILDNNITPFLDVKAGYAFLDLQGVYFSPSLGCRFGLSDNIALNLSFNYQLQGAKASYEYYDWTIKLHYLGLRLGVEF